MTARTMTTPTAASHSTFPTATRPSSASGACHHASSAGLTLTRPADSSTATLCSPLPSQPSCTISTHKKPSTNLRICATRPRRVILTTSRITASCTPCMVMKDIAHPCKRDRSKTWGKDGWKKVIVCIVSDGRRRSIRPR
ncbi:hypothetical protein EDB86DRAFT_1499257 [Lactarius hatsudake]|nr:hypothetical protein EDB86DRAFT_1499257 [Lactarius hatsudake]